MTSKVSCFTLVLAAVVLVVTGSTAWADCTEVAVSPSSKGILTAKQVAKKNERIAGEVDATGCDIGVYVPDGVRNVRILAQIHDANQYGVFNNGDARVERSEIYNIGHHIGPVFAPNGDQTGVGVYFWDASGSVTDSSIHDYQKNGFAINGQSRANVTGNDVAGGDQVDFIAQNGIQFGYGATGNVMRNVVTGNWYTGASWASTGILVFEAGGVSVQGNVVRDNLVGIAVEAWCYLERSADNNRIVSNTVLESDWGISIAAYSFYSYCDASASNNKVINNSVRSSLWVDGDTGAGVSIGTGIYNGAQNPTAHNNKLIHNTITGFELPIEEFAVDDEGATASKIHANVIP